MKFIPIIIFALCLASFMTQNIGLSNLLTDTASSTADSLSILGLGSVVDTLSQPVQLVTNTVGAVADNPTDLLDNPPLGLLGTQPDEILLHDSFSQKTYNPPNVLNNIPVALLATNTVGDGSLLAGASSQSSTTNKVPLLGGVTGLLGQTVQNIAGMLIDSSSKKCYEKQYQLQGDYIDISFNFKLLTTLLIKDSSILVNLDGLLLYKIVVNDNGKTIKVPIKSKIGKGFHVLSFCPQGALTEPLFSGLISNLLITEKQCLPQWGVELITNGGFENTLCEGQMCYFTTQNFQPSYISGWIPTPEIKIERALNLNVNLGNSWVIELDASKNTCIRQFLNIKIGRYVMKFDWAARGGTPFQTNGLELRINGYLLKSVTPKDYNLHTELVDFNVGSAGRFEISFCGTGISDSYGTLIDNIKLNSYDQCSNFKMNKY